MRLFSRVSWSVALLLLKTGHVLARLSQKMTNGNSLLGDISQSSLAEFLTDNPLPDGYPWGKATAFNTNYYTSSPDTGFVPGQVQRMSAKRLKVSFGSSTGLFLGVFLHRMAIEDQ